MPELWVAVVLFGAAVVQTTLGFGSTLVAMTLATLVWPVDRVMATTIPISVVQTAVVVARLRPEVRWDVLGGQLLPWMGVGLIAGLTLVGPGGAPWLRPALGVLVIALAARELFVRPRPLSGWGAGLAMLGGGFVQAVLATGGPLIVWGLSQQSLTPVQLRATLTAVWLGTDLVLSAILWRDGRIDADSLVRSAVMLVPVLAGIAVGERIAGRIDAAAFRKVVWVTLALAGVPLILGG